MYLGNLHYIRFLVKPVTANNAEMVIIFNLNDCADSGARAKLRW